MGSQCFSEIQREKTAFYFDDLDSDSRAFLKKYVPDAEKHPHERFAFITSTFDENDEPTALSREGEAVYDIIYCCTP